MRAVGIVRKVDELGRVVIPKELRRVLGMPEGTPLEIFTSQNGEVVLRKYEPGCEFCGSMENIKVFAGKHICQSCIDKLVMSSNQEKVKTLKMRRSI